MNEMKIKVFMKGLIDGKTFDNMKRILKINPSKNELRNSYEKYYSDINISNELSLFLIKKQTRSKSGVLVATIVLEPSVFSCSKNCAYCPTETDLDNNFTQPKSYLSSEPAMLRASRNNFKLKGQLYDRINSYINTGNIKDNKPIKLEIILSGGTWECYPYNYRNNVFLELYYYANIFSNNITNITNIREQLSLEEEIKINETTRCRIIGITIETRPDYVTKKSIRDYRRWGVTRVQLGVQHYNDDILRKINRECYTKDTIRAIKMLKDCAFKIVCHLMPDLPGSSPELDKWMFNEALYNPDLQFDDVKIYPTAICKSSSENLIVKSDINDWYNQGLYKPYSEENINLLYDLLIYYKTNIQPWIRIQRLVRDIPMQSIEAGYNKISNLRQILQDKMKERNLKCKCIRCMEIGNNIPENIRLTVRKYSASEGIEYFISIESNEYNIIDNILYKLFLIFNIFNKKIYWKNNNNNNTYNGLIGFCRLRLNNNSNENIFDELKNSALIRELHVYSSSTGIGNNDNNSQQHKGYGMLLVKTAEEIALQNNFNKIIVIAGVGVREYYKNKCGYSNSLKEGGYMVKYIKSNNKKYIKSNNNNIIRNILISLFYYFSIFIIFNYIDFNLFISFIILLFYISLFCFIF
jgi:ELP3 family radical SAM enzyme/protein acetyltransferase